MSGEQLRTTRHTRRRALRVLHERTGGHGHESVGAFIHRMRVAGLADSRIGRLLGFPDSAEPESIRRRLVQWERDDGLRTEVDSQARANVTHAEKRVVAACRRMQIPIDADPVHFTLEADLDPGTAAAGVLEYLAELVGLLEAEIGANVLHLPREAMPGARPVAWSEVRERIASLRAGLDDAKRRAVVAEYIEDQQRRQDNVQGPRSSPVAASMLAELHGHAREAEIFKIIGNDPDDAASGDMLGHKWTRLYEDRGDPADHDDHKVGGRRRRIRLMNREREHITNPRKAARNELFLEQQVGDLRIAALRPK
jgi:hypothetical protein